VNWPNFWPSSLAWHLCGDYQMRDAYQRISNFTGAK
jgi:hypothetical protein